MSGLGTAAKTALLKLILQNVAWANVGDAAGLQPSTVAGNVYVALHTADPTAAGDQSSGEATYPGYARVAVPRSAAKWGVAGGIAQNLDDIVFAICGAIGAPQAITHFSIGLASAGAGVIIGSNALPSTLLVSQNIIPELLAGALTTS